MILSALVLIGIQSGAAAPAPSARREEVKTTARIVEKRVAPGEAAPIQLASESLVLTATAPEGAPQLSEELHDAHWAKLEIGGLPVHFALGHGAEEGSPPAVAWIDLDANGRFGDGERVTLAPEAREVSEGVTMWSGEVKGLEAKSAGTLFPFDLAYSDHPARGLSARVAFTDWREAGVTIDGRDYVLALLDADHDGTCKGEQDRWFLFRAGERPERPATAYAQSAFGEGRFLDGRRFTVRVDDCSGLEIVARAAAGPDPVDLERHRERVERLWFERFDAERDAFVAARGIDASRPRNEKPIPWRYVSFAEAVDLAAQAEKPLFVDVLAFWCVWCYRMDYYTYVDAEVARLLRDEFIPVKIVQEQAAEGDYELVHGKLEAQGIPAMGVFDGQGNVLHKISGWKKPEEFVADLQQGLAAFRGEGH